MPHIDFYFDYSSPYAYIASERLDEIRSRTGATIALHPILLGFLFKEAGTMPLLNYPLKGDYARNDMARTARYYGLSYQLPKEFPMMTVAAARLSYWLESHAPDKAEGVMHALFRKIFHDGVNITETNIVLDVAESCGFDRTLCANGMSDPAVKQRLKEANDTALAKGVFGAPFFIVGAEPFWGVDHIDQMVEWVNRGGW